METYSWYLQAGINKATDRVLGDRETGDHWRPVRLPPPLCHRGPAQAGTEWWHEITLSRKGPTCTKAKSTEQRSWKLLTHLCKRGFCLPYNTFPKQRELYFFSYSQLFTYIWIVKDCSDSGSNNPLPRSSEHSKTSILWLQLCCVWSSVSTKHKHKRIKAGLCGHSCYLWAGYGLGRVAKLSKSTSKKSYWPINAVSNTKR